MRHENAFPLARRAEGQDEGAERSRSSRKSRGSTRPVTPLIPALSPRGERGRVLVALVLVLSTSAFADSGVVGRSQLGGAGLQRVRSAEVAPHSLGVGADVG